MSDAFNSLSRDHGFRGSRRPFAARGAPFNSLSRDHQIKLAEPEIAWVDFQLPLSGSLEIEINSGDIVYVTFQLPLSGSRDHLSSSIKKLQHKLSYPFNSLSRDHKGLYSSDIVVDEINFQLPLSGSQYFCPGSHDVGSRAPSAFNSLSRDH